MLPAMLLALLACWQPGDYTPPQPETLPPPAVDPAVEASMLPGPEDPPGPEPEAAVQEPEAATQEPAPAAPEPPDPPAMDPYAAHTVGAPLTLVDDMGQPLVVITTPHTPVIVLDEQEGLRRKVRCDTCTPPVEGWLQWAVVEKK